MRSACEVLHSKRAAFFKSFRMRAKSFCPKTYKNCAENCKLENGGIARESKFFLKGVSNVQLGATGFKNGIKSVTFLSDAPPLFRNYNILHDYRDQTGMRVACNFEAFLR